MIESIMQRLGGTESLYRDGDYAVISPTDGGELGRVAQEGPEKGLTMSSGLRFIMLGSA